MKKNLVLASLLSLLTIVGVNVSALAADLSKPEGRVILTVSGDIQHSNDGADALLDQKMLDALVQKNLTVETPWTEGEVTFQGPLLRDVLALVGASGDTVKAVALNDYSIDIPVSDTKEFDVILASSMNGKRLSVRDKGPLWVIYPWSGDSDLKIEKYYSRSIWQLKSIVVE